MLSYNEFLVLQAAERSGKISQRVCSEEIGISLGTVNKIMGKLKDRGYVDECGVTPAGYAALEPYRVKRAIFLAAGFGSRMMPITLNTPKPMVKVHGKRIIDALLDAVIAAGIEEIYIVRGYLKEQFNVLLEKYPNIRFIDNPLYNQTNNISSALCAGDKLVNAYVLESDLLLANPKLISKYQYDSNQLGIPVDRTDDYCIYTKGRFITGVGRGGENCHQAVGIVYWNEADGTKLVEDIKDVFYNFPAGKESFYNYTALVHHRENYRLAIRECRKEDIVEIDSFKELMEIDPAYRVEL